MTSSQAGLVLEHLHRLAGSPRAAQPSDEQLLGQLAQRRDEDAFAELVRRHGPMVLGVCRSILRHEQDAEDAFQATFLILLRKVASIRQRGAVAGWLHRVAHHVALRVQATTARHRAREREAIPPAPADPVLDITLRDLQRVLHEELRRLPDRYRLPLVLCYLEGRSQAEAAEQLGWSRATLRGRLDRGREHLRRRLAARGVALSALLCASIVAPRAAAEALVDAVVRAAAGAASPRASALAEGILCATFPGKLKAATALLAVSLLAGAAALMRQGKAKDEPSPSAPVKADVPGAKPAARERTIRGKVLGPDGKPIPAELFLLGLEGGPRRLGKAAADGTFRVNVPLGESVAHLVARAEGHAIDFLTPATDTADEVTFRLVEERPIRGRVIDTQGRPVAGVEVSVGGVGVYSRRRLDRFFAFMKKRELYQPLLPGERSLLLRREASHVLPNGERLLAAKTGADGRFTLPNIGESWTAWVDVKGRELTEQRILVVNREGFDPEPINRATQAKRQRDRPGNSPLLEGPLLTVVAEAEKVIRGVVRETDTGKPRAGVRVWLDQQDPSRLPRLSAVTDANGRYEIRGAKRAAGYRLSVRRDTAAAMLGRTVERADAGAGLEPQTVDIGVAKGVLLTGRVIDVGTGKPIPGFACVGILANNTGVRARPEYASPDCYDEADTDAGGVFRTVVVPGRILLMGGPRLPGGSRTEAAVKYKQQRFDPAFPDYFNKDLNGFFHESNSLTFIQGQYCKVLTVKHGEKAVRADVLLQPAKGFALRFRDAQGKPVRETLIAGNTATDWLQPVTNLTDAGTVYDLDAHHPRRIVVYQPRRQLAATVTLKGDEKPPLTVTLLPAGRAKGKLIDADGKPLANAAVRIDYLDRPAAEMGQVISDVRAVSGPDVTTDAAGEFVVGPLLPGERFIVTASVKGTGYRPPEAARAKGYTAEAGKTTDLGTLRLRANEHVR
jgi:RNA polymerase sigma factor (sigma-70 family)